MQPIILFFIHFSLEASLSVWGHPGVTNQTTVSASDPENRGHTGFTYFLQCKEAKPCRCCTNREIDHDSVESQQNITCINADLCALIGRSACCGWVSPSCLFRNKITLKAIHDYGSMMSPPTYTPTRSIIGAVFAQMCSEGGDEVWVMGSCLHNSPKNTLLAPSSVFLSWRYHYPAPPSKFLSVTTRRRAHQRYIKTCWSRRKGCHCRELQINIFALFALFNSSH